MGIEYFFWLPPSGRLALFILLIAGTLFLIGRYIFWPLLFLLGIRKDLTEKQAAAIIGAQFPKVGDRLRNLLDLSEDDTQSELLLASIDQKSRGLSTYDFKKAASYSTLRPYLGYLGIPLIAIIALIIFGLSEDWLYSYKRVLAYEENFEKPAPFSFVLLTDDLEVLRDQPFELQVTTEGNIRPENLSIIIGNNEFAMQEKEPGVFRYLLKPPLSTIVFSFRAGEYISASHQLVVRDVPVILDFQLEIKEPEYLGGRARIVKGTGNAVIPQGSKVSWMLEVENADEISLKLPDTIIVLNGQSREFTHVTSLYQDLPYTFSTSNKWIRDYETLSYTIDVIPDEFPRIEVEEFTDSLQRDNRYYEGIVQDDHKLDKLVLKLRKQGSKDDVQSLELLDPESSTEEFRYLFPSGLNLEPGVPYILWFEVTDNDGLRGGKVSRSQEFLVGTRTQDEKRRHSLQEQKQKISSLQEEIKRSEEQFQQFKDYQKQALQQKSLDYMQKEKLEDLLKREQQRESMMRKFSGDMKKLMEETREEDPLLKERLERMEKEARANESALEELRELGKKIQKEELQKKLDELGKKQSKSNRDLQQLLELTKRYYVTEKTRQLSRDYKKLAEEQLNNEEPSEEQSAKQKDLMERAQEVGQSLDSLLKDNRELKKPLRIPQLPGLRNEIKAEQQEALKKIEKRMPEDAGESMKKAGEGLKEMGEQLEQGSMSASGEEAMQEDAEVLRQILDNLVEYSFGQETLLQTMSEDMAGLAPMGKEVKEQQQLKELFEHVDDSLFALSLRRAEISELVNEQVTEVYYNIEKAQESFREGQKYQGVSYQQFALTAANTLADFLVNLLDNMQKQLQMGQGSGKEGDFQLPDLIQSQEELQKKMEGQGSKEGDKGPKGNEQGKNGEQGEKGEKGERGENTGGGTEQGNGSSGEDNPGEGKGGQGSEGQNDSEGNGAALGYGEIYEIYMEQQEIRRILEEQLENMLNAGDKELARKLVQQMRQFERELIENGVNQATLARMDHIRQQLWKLEDAAIEQGEEELRESEVSKYVFNAPIVEKRLDKEKISPETEELRRQALPLRRELQEMVKKYFGKDD